MNDQELLRYSRHILLPRSTSKASRQSLDARVLVLGAGGLGSPAAMYLAAAGVGTIVLCDGDTVDLTNLQRQILHAEESVGMAKVLSGARTLERLNPHVRWRRSARLEGATLEEAVGRADLVLDCSDNCNPPCGQSSLCSPSQALGVRCGDPLRRATRGVRLAPDGQPLLSLPVSGRRRCG